MSGLRAIAPYFFVRNIHAAVAYYRDVLGFTVDKLWGEPPGFAMPHRDKLTIMLCQDAARVHPHGGGTWDAYVWVDDADALFAEFEGRGVVVEHGPVDRPWYNNREFAVRDVDGHVIAFAHMLGTYAEAIAGAEERVARAAGTG